ncbi:MAG TPA: dienelactone hydrolase family protein [Hyphomicrobiaceae bacterium]|nr:dienelactone hydrolase family protein [Hyphomicrobiaceae bacterium]
MTDRPPQIPTNTIPPITQEMIDLYDEYTHITLDRRAYLARLTALVGTTAAATTITSLIEADQATAQIVAADDARLKTERVTFPGEGGEMAGYLARPANATGKLPGVIIIHENRGLVPHIQDVTRRMALEGFLALGPDFLHQSGGTPADEDKGRDMIGKLDRARTVANAVASLRYLKAHPLGNGKVGATGFCWGGGITNALAVAAGPDLSAAAPYYGAQPAAADVPRIKARLLLHYAQNDDRINAGIPAYRAALDKAGVKYELFTYDGTQHAFNNDTSAARYNKPAADLAWSRTVALFKDALR